MADADLIAAARFERDWRGERYPKRIAAGESDAEAASIDYQCWVAIARWLETGTFESFAGGADPDRPDAPVISWPELELAAQSAMVGVTAKCDRLFTGGGVEAGAYEAACARRASLWAIHRKVQLRRQSIDHINAEFKKRKAA